MPPSSTRQSRLLPFCSLAVYLALAAVGARFLAAQTPPPAGPVAMTPMAVDATPAFEVATIRPSDPNNPRAAGGWSFESEGRRLQCRQATVLDILTVIYGLQPRQIVGGPAWLGKDRFDIAGVPDVPGAPDPDQIRGMYKQLLADRFHLVAHNDTRPLSIYALTVAKGGPLLQLAKPGEPVNAGNSSGRNQRTIHFTNMSMQEFARNLTLSEDRPVVDQTGLPGRYDFTLKWSTAIASNDQPDAPPALFPALREQLGLQMTSTRGPAEVLVLDRLEKPTDP